MPRRRRGAPTIADAGGLHLHASAAGTRTRHYKYRTDGKKLLFIDLHPEVSLKAAWLARDEAKATLAKGRDPALERRRIKLVGQGRAEETFEKWARDWYEQQKGR